MDFARGEFQRYANFSTTSVPASMLDTTFSHLTKGCACTLVTSTSHFYAGITMLTQKTTSLLNTLYEKVIPYKHKLSEACSQRDCRTDNNMGQLLSRGMHVVLSMMQGISSSRCSAIVTSAAFTSQSRISESV